MEQKLQIRKNKVSYEEKLEAELANIQAEEIARNAEEMHLKEERRLAAEKEAQETKARLQEYIRFEKLKVEKAKADLKALVMKEHEERLSREHRLAEKKNSMNLPKQSEKQSKIANSTSKTNEKKPKMASEGLKRKTCLNQKANDTKNRSTLATDDTPSISNGNKLVSLIGM